MNRAHKLLPLVLAALMLGSCTSTTPGAQGGGISKIRHVIVIMQENRSFDSYFGTFPGADGIPMRNGSPTVCIPDPQHDTCVRPSVDHADVNSGGPHAQFNAVDDINGDKMDGFISQAESGTRGCQNDTNPICALSSTPDVMGYHTESDIPNYWTYAKDFVLQDHMFEPTASWSLPAHLFELSEWSALCATHNPASCKNDNEVFLNAPPDFGLSQGRPPIYAWTDLTYLLHRNGVSWAITSSRGPNRTARTTLRCPALPCPRMRTHRVSGIRCPISTRSRPTGNSAISSRWTISMRQPGVGDCLRCPGWCPLVRSASIQTPPSAMARAMSRAWSTLSCAAPTGARPPSS